MIIAVMPAYNEEKKIGEVLKATGKYVDKIIVVDDCSRDNTAMVAKKLGVIVIKHDQNKGLGGALRTGFGKALEISKNDSDIIITIDSDGQHVASDIPKFIDKINSGYGFVLGQRDVSRYPMRKRIGNRMLTFLTNLVCGTNLRDTESGFRAFTKSALNKLDLRSERYEIAAEIIKEVGRRRIKSTNVPVESPIYFRGKGVKVSDGIKNFLYILKR
jgi:glycosyltransferase involved in cell wall biosynthesis